MLMPVFILLCLVSEGYSYLFVCYYCMPPIMRPYFPKAEKFDSCATSASWKTLSCSEGCYTGTVRGHGKSMTVRTCGLPNNPPGCVTQALNENEATTNCNCKSDKCNAEIEAPEQPYQKKISSVTSYPCAACVPDADQDVIDGARGGGDCLTVPNGTQYQCMTDESRGCTDVYTTSSKTKTTYVKRRCSLKPPDVDQKNKCVTTTNATSGDTVETCHCTARLCNAKDLRHPDGAAALADVSGSGSNLKTVLLLYWLVIGKCTVTFCYPIMYARKMYHISSSLLTS